MGKNQQTETIVSNRCGNQSVKLPRPAYIHSSSSVVGKKEGEGRLKDYFDMISEDDYFGTKSWEDAESTLQKEAVTLAIGKGKIKQEELDYILSGDLLGQSIASSFGLKNFETPLFGLYGACSTCGESLSLGSMLIAAGYANNLVCVTSSHFASAEKEFRYPLAYGNQRPKSSTWTVTGSGAFVLSSLPWENDRAVITAVTTGIITDYGLKDSMNMGACMAPAAASTIYAHLTDFNVKPEEYDRIITGDLGTVGQTILFELLREKGFDISKQHMDCGIEIFDGENQGTEAGGSGCGCAATVLSAYILKQIEEGVWKKVLFIPTGALLSKTSFNEGKSVPGIAHAVVLEGCK